jgi:cyclic pyranopterin phosphate synthase
MGPEAEKKDAAPLVDTFGRTVSYLRVSVTDRCDLRCTYCMSEDMTFLPRSEVLSLEEMERLCRTFIGLGVTKIRLTGGEPLVRRNIMQFVEALGACIGDGLDELTLTTNGTLLARYAGRLREAGVRRVNVSLDTLDAGRYREITRFGSIHNALAGIDAALEAGLRVKINAVAQRGAFETELDRLIRFAHGRGMDLTLIEEMPLGLGQGRAETYLPITELRAALERRWSLIPVSDSTGGPARYVRVDETGGRLGFITPLSCSFCSACSRVRLDCTGRLFTCMGHAGSIDLRPALYEHSDTSALEKAIRAAIYVKPKGHDFAITGSRVSGIERTMSVLGG